MSRRGVTPRGLIRQGDVLLVPTDRDVVDGEAPASRREVKRVDGRLVLAEGEATGHAHVVHDGHARLERQEFGEQRRVWSNRGSGSRSRIVLIVECSPVTLVHEEHEPLTLPPGSYLVRRQREYVPTVRGRSAGWRRVAD
jgi:hypothetical protein